MAVTELDSRNDPTCFLGAELDTRSAGRLSKLTKLEDGRFIGGTFLFPLKKEAGGVPGDWLLSDIGRLSLLRCGDLASVDIPITLTQISGIEEAIYSFTVQRGRPVSGREGSSSPH